MKSKKGFTLIELLVVISIIGLLTALALASLNSARNRAKDASAKASITSIQHAASFYAETTGGSYAKLCADDTQTLLLLDAATAIMNHLAECQEDESFPNNDWAAEILLLDNTYWCTDSTGFSGRAYSTLSVSGAVCDTTP